MAITLQMMKVQTKKAIRQMRVKTENGISSGFFLLHPEKLLMSRAVDGLRDEKLI